MNLDLLSEEVFQVAKDSRSFSLFIQTLFDKDYHLSEKELENFYKEIEHLPKDPFLLLIEEFLSSINEESYGSKLPKKKYVARLLEYTLLGYGDLSKVDSSSKILNWLTPSKKTKYLRHSQEYLLKLYWRLKIIIAQSEGDLLCDGIRIVRTQNNE